MDPTWAGDLIDKLPFLLRFFFFLRILFVYSFFTVLDLLCCVVFSLVTASGGYSVVAVCRLLIFVASLVAEH